MRTTGAKSVPGHRPYQQDWCCHLTAPPLEILAVCDGNGGEGGDELSRVGCRALVTFLGWELAQDMHQHIETEDHLHDLGIRTITYAAAEASRAKESRPRWAGAGTTITLVLVTPTMIGTFWIGDSPAMLYHRGALEMLTTPLHTLTELLIARGHSRESLANQPGLGSTLTRCAGHEVCEPDVSIVRLVGPSFIVVGSDGLLTYLPEPQLRTKLAAALSTDFCPETLAGDLVQTALENGSDDNVTAVVALAQPRPKPTRHVRRTTRLLY